MTSYVYDGARRLIQTNYPDGTHASTTYDAAGRSTSSTDALGHVTAEAYDNAGRLTSTTDALGHITTFAYDAVGNRTSMTDRNGHATSYTHDAKNRKIKTTYSDASFDSTTYDNLGRVATKTDQAGKTTTYQYDAVGDLTKVTDALGGQTTYTYDEVNNRISQTDANGHTTTFAYDQMGRMTKRTLPAAQVETFTYDAAGNKITHTDFNSHVTTYSYDSMNRPITKTPDAAFGAPPVTFTYTQTGQRASMNDALGADAYSYDLRDRLLTKVTPIGTLTYTYNGTGRLLTIRSSNAGGATVDYGYDVLNRLTTVTDNNLPGSSTYTYDNVGNQTGETNPNGVLTAYTYNGLNRLTNETITKGGALASYAYTLGVAGNRTSVAELSGRSVGSAYDALYRLTNETVTGSSANFLHSYTYDAVGNRVSDSTGGAPLNSTYDADDRLTIDTFDANGNTLVQNSGTGGNTYTYDFEDHVVTVSPGGISYVYDGDGRRVRKTTPGGTTNYLVDDRNPSGLPQVVEEISAGVVQRVYVYGLARISERQGGVTSFYGYDGRGSVRLLTNSAGAVTDNYDFDAFGVKVASVGITPNDFLFSGEQFDSSMGVYYMRARYMNQFTGRFLTMDPMPGTTTDPRSLHRYLYAANDPVNKTDPTGNQFDLVSISISISIDTSIQQIYTTQLVHTFFDVQQLAYCCLQPALVLEDVALSLIVDDGPDWAWDLYEGAREAEAKSYQMIAMRIAQTYKNILHDIGHAEFELTIPLVDYKIKKEIDLADITGLPDYSKNLEDAQSALDSFFGEWKDLLDTADSAGNCDVSKFINKWGTKLADKVLGKILVEVANNK